MLCYWDRFSVCLSVCLWRALAVSKQTTFCRIYLYHLIGQASGSGVGKHYIGPVGHRQGPCRPVFKKKIARLVGRLGSGHCLVGRLGSGPRLMGRLGPGVRVSPSFQKMPVSWVGYGQVPASWPTWLIFNRTRIKRTCKTTMKSIISNANETQWENKYRICTLTTIARY